MSHERIWLSIFKAELLQAEMAKQLKDFSLDMEQRNNRLLAKIDQQDQVSKRVINRLGGIEPSEK